MPYSRTFALVAAVALFPVLAEAAGLEAVKDNTNVTIEGAVKSLDANGQITVQTKSGPVDVNLNANQPIVVKQGDNVAAQGKVSHGLLGTEVNATNVEVEKGMLKRIDEAVTAAPGLKALDAETYRVSDLPKAGMVKVTGTVADVTDGKAFLLRDESGSIKVQVQGEQLAQLKFGTRVTVVGSVDSGLFTSKRINANQVLIISPDTAVN